MAGSLQQLVFALYEQRRLRNWFYTLAFAVFVPTGCRFAILAWEYGDWFDKPLSILAGLLIGITAIVTLMRVWSVPPRQTAAAGEHEDVETIIIMPNASDMYAAAKRKAARNREVARGARALGTAHEWPFAHY